MLMPTIWLRSSTDRAIEQQGGKGGGGGGVRSGCVLWEGKEGERSEKEKKKMLKLFTVTVFMERCCTYIEGRVKL